MSDLTNEDEEIAKPTESKRRPLMRSDGQTYQTDIETTALMILPDGSLEEVSPEEALEKKTADISNGSWIDVSIRNNEEAFEKLKDTLLKDLELSSFIQRHIGQPYQLRTTQVLPLNHAMFVVIRVLDDWDPYRHVALLCLKTGVMLSISLQPSNLPSNRKQQHWFRNDALDFIRSRELPQASVSGCLLIYFTHFLTKTALAAQKLRQQVLEKFENLESNVSCIELSDIVDLKDDLMKLLAVAEEQNECIESLSEAEALTDALDFSNLKGSVGVVKSMASNTERLLDRLEKRVGDIRHGFDAHQQDRINYRLNLLTIMSAVFLPLSLMAGVWGMNFVNMPELERENAYYCALGSMAGVAALLMFGFYWNGWLQ